MPESCCAIGCTNRRKKKEENVLSFYKIPSSRTPLRKEKRRLWLLAIRRENWSEANTRYARLCSAHFISGKTSDDPNDPDFVPTLFGIKKPPKKLDKQRKDNYERFNLSRKSLGPQQLLPAIASEHVPSSFPDAVEANVGMVLGPMNVKAEADMRTDDPGDNQKCRCTELLQENAALSAEVTNLRRELRAAVAEKEKIQEKSFSYKNIKNDKTMLKFYTGLENPELFMWLLLQCQRAMMGRKVKHTSCSWQDQMLMVLMKMRLGVKDKDTACRYGIHRTTVSRIIRAWIPKMAATLKETIIWPSRLSVSQHLPQCFKKQFKQTVAIIDCKEIRIERPLNLASRAETYSNCKNHNTIKYFVSITPSGAVSFISPRFGGGVSDKEITLSCGFLDKLDYGDDVLADRNFDVKEEMATRGCRLMVPTDTRGELQVSKEEADTSQKLSNIQIHVERVIGRMKSFNVLHTIIPITQVDILDEMVTICAGLANLNASGVPMEQ